MRTSVIPRKCDACLGQVVARNGCGGFEERTGVDVTAQAAGGSGSIWWASLPHSSHLLLLPQVPKAHHQPRPQATLSVQMSVAPASPSWAPEAAGGSGPPEVQVRPGEALQPRPDPLCLGLQHLPSPLCSPLLQPASSWAPPRSSATPLPTVGHAPVTSQASLPATLAPH